MGVIKKLVVGLLVAAMIVAVFPVVPAHAAGEDTPFAIQVTPSPLVTSIKPGENKTLDLQIRNTGSKEERLKVELRAFKADESGNIQLLTETPTDVKDWVSFSAQQFTVKPGEWFTEQVRLRAPQDAGFSYSFAIVVARANPAPARPGQQAIIGSVAVFTLVMVDRPGAIRQFGIAELQSSKRVFEYVPASFTIKLKNTGNTIVQPTGNVFIQRSSRGDPITVLPLNPTDSYLLPGVTRSLELHWKEGFPVYQTVQAADNAPPTKKLVWDFGKVQQFRFGRYVAKVVAIYNDGQRDVPVMAEVSFWVIPWKLLLGAVVVVALLCIGAWVIIRRILKVGRRGHAYHSS